MPRYTSDPGTGTRTCTVHALTFASTASCTECDADPNSSAEFDDDPAGAPVKAPRGCMTSEQIERAYVTEAAEILRLRRKLVGKSKGKEGDAPLDLHAYNSIAKLGDLWSKLMRQAHACALAREHEAIVARRERERREIVGDGR